MTTVRVCATGKPDFSHNCIEYLVSVSPHSNGGRGDTLSLRDSVSVQTSKPVALIYLGIALYSVYPVTQIYGCRSHQGRTRNHLNMYLSECCSVLPSRDPFKSKDSGSEN